MWLRQPPKIFSTPWFKYCNDRSDFDEGKARIRPWRPWFLQKKSLKTFQKPPEGLGKVAKDKKAMISSVKELEDTPNATKKIGKVTKASIICEDDEEEVSKKAIQR